MLSFIIKTITCIHTHILTHFNIFSSPLLLSTSLLFFCFALLGVEFRFGCAVDDVVVSDEEDQKDKRITGTYVD